MQTNVKMRGLTPFAPFVFVFLLVGCDLINPPLLRSVEVARISSLEKETSFKFAAPFRNVPEGLRYFMLSLVLPEGEDPNFSGTVSVLNSDNELVQSFSFKKTKQSSWAQNDRTAQPSWAKSDQLKAYLVFPSLNMDEGKTYKVRVLLNKPSDYDIPVLLHYNWREQGANE